MKRSKVTGIVGTLLLHIVALLLLFFITLSMPEQQEEGGVPVMLGNMEMAGGDADPYTLTEVDLLPEPQVAQPLAASGGETEQPLITQTDEPSLKVKQETEKVEKNDAEVKTEQAEQPREVKTQEQIEAEKRAKEERAAAEAAASKIAGAFGKGSKMGSTGNDTGEGNQGSPTGNGNTGKTSGVGSYGTFDLNGRSLGSEGLPIPVYNVQDEGRVVVTIVVNPEGKVIATSINKRTNTVNPALRRAAEEAARRARFNAVSGVNNQSGTITYYFKLK